MSLKTIFFGGRAYMGKENAGGTVKFYQPGDTSTPKATYTDSTYLVENPVSVPIDANGFCSARLLGDYSVIVFNAKGNQLYQEDSINPQEDSESVAYNLIINGSFETDSDNDGVPDGFALTQYDATQTNALDDTDSSHGEKSMLFTSAGSGGGYITSEGFFLVSDLQTLQLNFDIKSSVVDVRNLVEVLWYEGDKSAITPSVIYDESSVNPTSWTRKAFNVIPPLNSRFAKIRLHGCHSSDVTAGNTRYDNVSLVEILPAEEVSSSEVEFVVTDNGDYSDYAPLRCVPQFPWSSPAKLSNPAALPAGAGNGVAVSANGEFVSVAHATTPFVTNYQRAGVTFNKLANPAALPASTGYGVAYSESSEFLAVTHATTPFVTIYQRSGSTYTKLTNPLTLPTGSGNGSAFSSNGEFLAVAHDTTPYLRLYRRDGATPTVFDNIAISTAPTSNATSCAWSRDGRFLAVTVASPPYLVIYERSVTTLTKLSDPAITPTGVGRQCAWSPNADYLYIAHETTPFLTVYSRSDTTFTKINDPSTLPAGNAHGVSVSPNGKLIAVAHEASPFITVYNQAVNALAKLPDPSSLPAGIVYDCAWSPTNEFLYVSHAVTPFITIYQTASDMPDLGRAVLRKIERYGT